MRDDSPRRRSRALLCKILSGGDAFYSIRCGSSLPVSLGGHSARHEDVRVLGDAGVYQHRSGRFLLRLEKGCARLGKSSGTESDLMALTNSEELKTHPALARLLDWSPSAVKEVKFDRDEMTIYLERAAIREACALLRDNPGFPFNYLSDVTCVDWYPTEPRFEVVYHLLSIPKKERVRLKAHLHGSSPVIDSVTPVWPSGDFF